MKAKKKAKKGKPGSNFGAAFAHGRFWYYIASDATPPDVIEMLSVCRDIAVARGGTVAGYLIQELTEELTEELKKL